MAPSDALELPDVPTNGCEDGVEFVFLADDDGDDTFGRAAVMVPETA